MGVRSLHLKGSWEYDMATHFGILAGRIPWAEEPGGLQSMGSQRIGHEHEHVHSTRGMRTISVSNHLPLLPTSVQREHWEEGVGEPSAQGIPVWVPVRTARGREGVVSSAPLPSSVKCGRFQENPSQRWGISKRRRWCLNPCWGIFPTPWLAHLSLGLRPQGKLTHNRIHQLGRWQQPDLRPGEGVGSGISQAAGTHHGRKPGFHHLALLSFGVTGLLKEPMAGYESLQTGRCQGELNLGELCIQGHLRNAHGPIRRVRGSRPVKKATQD